MIEAGLQRAELDEIKKMYKSITNIGIKKGNYKMIADANWKSLSIPKNKSSENNADKFSKPKHNEHFTDEFLKKKI